MVNDENGDRYPSGGEYREVVPPERLVFTWGDPDEAIGLATVTFEDLGGKTAMTFHLTGLPDDPKLYGDVHSGWASAFDHLTQYLEER
ncbi:hypothetical protein GCM10029964_122710 [Kibdelosporangium lantanae]